MKTFQEFMTEGSLEISIHDIKPTKAAEKDARAVAKLMKSGMAVNDAISDVVKTRMKKGVHSQMIKNALRKMGVLKEAFELLQTPVERLWQDDNSYAASKGYKIYAGGAGFMKSKLDIALYYPTGDEKYVADSMKSKLKSGEVLFRYINPRIRAIGYMPIVKINIKKGLIYYNKPEAADEDILDWEPRGEKLRFVNLRDDYKKYLKSWMYGH